MKIDVISSIKSPRKSTSKCSTDENNEHINKENGVIGLYNVKTKLQRLGKLYSGKLHFIIQLDSN